MTRSGSPRRCAATWTRWRSSGRTWSATRWAAGSRSRSPSASPRGSRASTCSPRHSPSGVAASWCRSCACCDPELAAIPHPLRTTHVREQFWSLFAQPERLDPAAADIAVDEFCRAYRSRAARVAFFAAARNIYLDEPHGEEGFYARLASLEPPALFIWGAEDRIIPPGFARHVAEALPEARQVVLEDCGHVPQVELAERTNRLIREQIEATTPVPASASASPRAARRARRADARRSDPT